VKITITDADYEAALARRFLDGKKAWREIQDLARKEAGARLVKENLVEQERLRLEAERMPTKTWAENRAWLAKHDELTRVGKRFNALLEIAYPRTEAE
jgi:hypothetical protein